MQENRSEATACDRDNGHCSCSDVNIGCSSSSHSEVSLAGQRQAQIRTGMHVLDWSRMVRLNQTYNTGMTRHRALQGTMPLEYNPITGKHIKAMHNVWSKEGDKRPMLWAATCMCFLG